VNKPLTRADVEALLIDLGHAINANDGRCYLVEEVLCRCTSLCIDVLELLAAAEGATAEYHAYLTRGEGMRSFIPSMDRLCAAVRRTCNESPPAKEPS
jgi:hypothetical protein